MSRDDGFTLVELLVAMLVGTIVLMGAFTVITQAMPATNRIADRITAQSRGRTAMEQALQDLRSVVCVPQGNGATFDAPFTSTADDGQVTFHAQLFAAPTGTTTTADPGRGGTFNPEKRTLQFTGGSLVETRYAGTFNTGTGNWTFSATGTQRVLLTNVAQYDASTPYFRYMAYDASGNLVALPTPVLAADLPRIVRVDVRFLAGPPRQSAGASTAQYAQLKDSATVPLPVDFTDATSTQKGPQCSF